MLSYPVIIEGYKYWKKRGSFTHPEEFIAFVDNKIVALKPMLDEVLTQCIKPVTPIHTLKRNGAKARCPLVSR